MGQVARKAKHASILEDQTGHWPFKRWISPPQKIAKRFKALDLTGLEKMARNFDLERPVVIADESARNNAVGIGIK